MDRGGGWGGGGEIFQTIFKCALSQSNRSEKSAESYPTVLPMTLKDNHYPQGNNNDNDNGNNNNNNNNIAL